MFDRIKTAAIKILTYLFENSVRRLVEWQSEDSIKPIVPVMDTHECMKDVSEHLEEITKEIMDNLHRVTPFKNDLYFGQDITDDGKWKKIYLKWYVPSPDYAYAMFPELMSVIDRNPDIRMAVISKLEAGGTIKPHAGGYRGSIRIQIGIDTPNDPNCFIWVGGYRYFWKNGEVIGFDDTYIHFVQNNTEKDRVVLLLDIDRKMKSKWSRKILDFISDYIVPLSTRSELTK